eukprot:TRINITY_DN74116_c0_g1_i1.p1 TRINITY_DN74116_c0_g1~~TRINITY_DN74116_c0_g1_i1.p1  ORF type:complete len:142 (-),score=15.76 TRINITY_DN74116_c0_g1_i1:209-634(-)
MISALASADESPSRSRQARIVNSSALASADMSPSKSKSVRITLPPRSEADAAMKIALSPVKHRRQRTKTTFGQHFYKYPGWFCSPDCGPHCCGEMTEAVKDHYYAPGSSPRSVASSPREASALGEKVANKLFCQVEDPFSL